MYILFSGHLVMANPDHFFHGFARPGEEAAFRKSGQSAQMVSYSVHIVY